MVPGDEPDAVPRLQVLERLDVAAPPAHRAVDYVSRAHREVRVRGVRERHYRLRAPARRRGGHVDVRNLHDAVSVERRGKPGALYLDFIDLRNLHAVPDAPRGERPRECGEEDRLHAAGDEEKRHGEDEEQHRPGIEPVPCPDEPLRKVRIERVASERPVAQELGAAEKQESRNRGLPALRDLPRAACRDDVHEGEKDENRERGVHKEGLDHLIFSICASTRPSRARAPPRP